MPITLAFYAVSWRFELFKWSIFDHGVPISCGDGGRHVASRNARTSSNARPD